MTEQLLTVTGRIHDIRPKITRSSGYTVQDVVLAMPKSSPNANVQYRKVTAVNAALTDLERFGVGDVVAVTFRPRGRYYTKSDGVSTRQEVANHDEAVAIAAAKTPI